MDKDVEGGSYVLIDWEAAGEGEDFVGGGGGARGARGGG